MLSLKFFGAVLPLLILGYILGTLLAAAIHGWHISMSILLLNVLGTLLALQNYGATLRR
jgi:hypothetical protein